MDKQYDLRGAGLASKISTVGKQTTVEKLLFFGIGFVITLYIFNFRTFQHLKRNKFGLIPVAHWVEHIPLGLGPCRNGPGSGLALGRLLQVIPSLYQSLAIKRQKSILKKRN